MSTPAATDRHGSVLGLLEQANDVFADTVSLRRELHRWPEIGNDLPSTREQVLAALEGLPLEITLHQSTSGIVATLVGDKPGDTVLLRGDMDALPMPEDTDLDFSSANKNRMHACGHDMHTSMLVASAKILSARKANIAGRVMFMFQPGEEGYGGAVFMLNEGMLDVAPLPNGKASPITGAFAMHMTPNIPTGMVGIRPGPTMASSDTLTIIIAGRGGHASAPHQALDPVPVACEIVQALQTLVTRRLDVFDPGVITVTNIHAGTAYNVIPETVEIKGTMRAISERTREQIHEGIQRVANGIATAHEMSATVLLERGYPVTINDDNFALFAEDVGRAVMGEKNVIRMPHPVMGAEDFSYVLHKLPGAMMFIGATPEGVNPNTAAPNHSNRAIFNEEAMRKGSAMYAAVALRHLNSRLT